MPQVNQITLTTNSKKLSGKIWDTGKRSTFFFDTIRSKTSTSLTTLFSTGQSYDIGAPSQPKITEAQSMQASSPTTYTPTNEENCAQIFQQEVQVSRLADVTLDSHEGVMAKDGTLVNVSEYDIQTSLAIQKMKTDIEYTLLRGAGNKTKGSRATYGLWNIVTTNVIDANSQQLTLEHIVDAQQSVRENTPYESDVFTWICNANVYRAINRLIVASGDVSPVASRNEAGYNINRWLSPMGMNAFVIVSNYYMDDTMLLGINLDVCSPVAVNLTRALSKEPNTTLIDGIFAIKDLDGKGGLHSELYTVMGLDHGAEKFHAKITNIGATSPATTRVSKRVSKGTIDSTILVDKLEAE